MYLLVIIIIIASVFNEGHFHLTSVFETGLFNMSPSKTNPSEWTCWFYLIGVNMVVFGVEVCASASFTYIPPLMLKLGFSGTVMGIVFGIGPLVSLFVVPMIGRCSDKMTLVWPFSGHREPFIVGLSVLMLFSLVVIPYCRELASLSGLSTVRVLAAGVILLDLTTQSLLNPCKALVSDVLLDMKQTDQGFTVFSFMLKSGSAFGYLITSLNWENTAIGALFGSQEKVVFVVMAILYSLFLMLTLATVFLKRSVAVQDAQTISSRTEDRAPLLVLIQIQNDTASPEPTEKMDKNKTEDAKTRKCHIKESARTHLVRANLNWRTNRKKFANEATSVFFSCRRLFIGFLRFIQSFTQLPGFVVRLFVVNLLCWMALNSHDLFFTDYVGKVMYHGSPNETELSVRGLYDEGVRTGSWALLLQCIFAALYSALLQDKMVRRFGERRVFFLGMATFSLCMLGTLFCTTSSFLEGVLPMEILALISGLGVASVNTIPNNLITRYHEDQKENAALSDQEALEKVERLSSGGRKRGVGEDMAVLDAASFLSQVIPAIFLGYLVDYFQSTSLYILFAAATAFLATIACSYVTYNETKTLR